MVRGRPRVLPSAAGRRGSAPARCTSPSACCTAAHWPGLSLYGQVQGEDSAQLGPPPALQEARVHRDPHFSSQMHTSLLPQKSYFIPWGKSFLKKNSPDSTHQFMPPEHFTHKHLLSQCFSFKPFLGLFFSYAPGVGTRHLL